MTFDERAARIIPGGAHTYSKGRDQFPANAPQALVRGRGARVRDLDGREFVDWGMGINNVLIGHAEPSIDDAACEALRQGQDVKVGWGAPQLVSRTDPKGYPEPVLRQVFKADAEKLPAYTGVETPGGAATRCSG